MKKISIKNRYSLIGTRDELAEYESLIQIMSSTSAQPYAGVNFLDGKPVGGRTLTEGEMQLMLKKAAEVGAEVTDG